MKKLTVLGLLLVVTLFYSCDDKENEMIVVQSTNESYLPLEIGNYWIYQNTQTIRDRISIKDNDTVRVTKDTLIAGNKYYVLEGNTRFLRTPITEYFRDSSGYIITPLGLKIFSDSNFSDILYSYIHSEPNQDGKSLITNYKMEKINDPVIVPAGSFNTLGYIGTTDDQIRDREFSCLNTFYAKNVGKVKQTWCFFVDPDSSIIEKELIEFHIQ